MELKPPIVGGFNFVWPSGFGINRYGSQWSNPIRARFHRSLSAAVAALILTPRLRPAVRKPGVDAGHPHLVPAHRALWCVTLLSLVRRNVLILMKKGRCHLSSRKVTRLLTAAAGQRFPR